MSNPDAKYCPSTARELIEEFIAAEDVCEHTYLTPRQMKAIAALRAYLAAPAQAEPLLEWAVERWTVEVSNRPMRNIHRRSLDDTWRQVIRRCGGDDVLLCGPRHDDLAAQAEPPPGKTWEHDAGAYARCSYCGRYSLNPRTLTTNNVVCDCGERYGWSGSFKPPTPESKWSGQAPAAPSPAAEDGLVERPDAPERIYLQVGEDDDATYPKGGGHGDEITWCVDKQFDRDVPYVRADIAAARIERLVKELRIAEAKSRGTLANNLCSDHRDKQSGKPCLACEIERQAQEIAELRALIENATRDKRLDGKTMLDFVYVWRDQAEDRARKAESSLAAALRRAEALQRALQRIAEHYTDTDLAGKHMNAIARAALSPTGDSRDYVRATPAETK